MCVCVCVCVCVCEGDNILLMIYSHSGRYVTRDNKVNNRGSYVCVHKFV